MRYDHEPEDVTIGFCDIDLEPMPETEDDADWIECPDCGGAGSVVHPPCGGGGCRICHFDGEVGCTTCGGKGVVPNKEDNDG